MNIVRPQVHPDTALYSIGQYREGISPYLGRTLQLVAFKGELEFGLNEEPAKDMTMELTDKAKSLLAKRGFDPVLGARPLRRTIQRELEDALSEKILFEEVGPGQIVTVDVDNWDGEGAGEGAVFTFTGTPKPAKSAEPDLPKAEPAATGGSHAAK